MVIAGNLEAIQEEELLQAARMNEEEIQNGMVILGNGEAIQEELDQAAVANESESQSVVEEEEFQDDMDILQIPEEALVQEERLDERELFQEVDRDRLEIQVGIPEEGLLQGARENGPRMQRIIEEDLNPEGGIDRPRIQENIEEERQPNRPSRQRRRSSRERSPQSSESENDRIEASSSSILFAYLDRANRRLLQEPRGSERINRGNRGRRSSNSNPQKRRSRSREKGSRGEPNAGS